MDYLRENTITMFAECARFCNELKLTLGERAVYNIIYTYCTKGKEKDCTLALTFFMQWTGLTKRGVINILNSLINMKLITKEAFTRNDSDVIRSRYKLVAHNQKSRAEFKADVSVFSKLKLDELQRQQQIKELKKQGLEPLPPDCDSNQYKGLKINPDGTKYLIPIDGAKNNNYIQRYYTKNEYENLYKDIHSNVIDI